MPAKTPKMRLKDRPTGDLLVLMISGTVCFGVLASGAIIAMVVLFHPETDVSNWISRINGILNTMVGLLAGFLAGRGTVLVKSDGTTFRSEVPDDPG
jgi:hypothetical protein